MQSFLKGLNFMIYMQTFKHLDNFGLLAFFPSYLSLKVVILICRSHQKQDLLQNSISSLLIYHVIKEEIPFLHIYLGGVIVRKLIDGKASHKSLLMCGNSLKTAVL